MSRRVSPALLALSLGAAACGGPAESDAPAAGAEPAAAGAAGATAECVNGMDGYSVRYPAEWHVNSGELLGPCALFHPDPFEVPRASEVPMEIAVSIDMEPVPFATVAGDTLGRTERSRERTMVGGRPAVRIEGETTGQGLYPPGIRLYQYLVDLGDSTLIAVVYGAGDLPFERKRRVLDAMMATLELRPAG